MATKPKMKGLITIDAYDIGGKTKYAQFIANNNGQFWPVDGADFKMQKTVTPHEVPAADFMKLLVGSLRKARFWNDGPVLRGFSVCGPMVNGTCLRLINRKIKESFRVGGAALNDCMAGLLGSLLAGVAKGHTGGIAYTTLGTGVGGAGRVYVSNNGVNERMGFEDWEMHYTVVSPDGVTHKCGCNINGCAEALVNEPALVDLLLDRKIPLEKLIRPQKTEFDAGRDLEYQINRDDKCEFRSQIMLARDIWHRRMAVVLSNVHGNHVLGGDVVRGKALFVLGGGLSRLVDPVLLKQYMLEVSDGVPQNGENIEVRREEEMGNRTGVIGAAATALMNKLNCGIEGLEYLPCEPLKKTKKK